MWWIGNIFFRTKYIHNLVSQVGTFLIYCFESFIENISLQEPENKDDAYKIFKLEDFALHTHWEPFFSGLLNYLILISRVPQMQDQKPPDKNKLNCKGQCISISFKKEKNFKSFYKTAVGKK